MMRRLLVISLLLFAPSLQACQLTVSAAASLTDVLRDIARNFEAEHRCRAVLNFGASSTLARQIEHGAPADVFISADDDKITQLVRRDLVDRANVRTVASNSLVIVTPPDSSLQLSDASQLAQRRFRRVAIAGPYTVPSGIYARRFLEREGLWRQLEPKVIPTDNVRSSLSAAALGEVDAAFVYATDVHSKQVRVIFRLPSEVTNVRYVAAVPSESRQGAMAKRFLSYLISPAAQQIFLRHGFGGAK